MGLLEKLWDDTLAGPRPDSGHGYLRKFSTFSFRSSSGKDSEGVNGRAMEDEETTKVSRQITIVRPPGYNSNQTAGSAPASPAGETPPPSPFSDPGHSGFRGQTRTKRQRAQTESQALLLLRMSEI